MAHKHSTPQECIGGAVSSPSQECDKVPSESCERSTVSSSSKTGTYAFRNGYMTKISDDVPHVSDDVSLGGKEDYMDDNLGDWNEKKQVFEPYHVTSKRDKKRRMKELGLQEVGGKDVKPHGKVEYHDMATKHATVFVGRR